MTKRGHWGTFEQKQNKKKPSPWDYRGGDTKRGEGGLMKVKKQVDFKIHFR